MIIPNVQKVAKLCADFKSGIETVFVNHENKQDVVEIDDFVRQGDYKYMYADSSMTTQKSEQADLVIQSVERFASLIPLNLQEIFVWYFEQKGVDSPERFLGSGVNQGVNQGANQGANPGVNQGAIPEGGEDAAVFGKLMQALADNAQTNTQKEAKQTAGQAFPDNN